MNITINNRDKLLNFFLEITDNDKKTIGYISNLLDVYPNILEYMLSNQTPDLNKVKWVKHKRYNMLKEKVLDNYDILKLNSLLEDAFSIKVLKLIKKYFENKFPNSNDVNRIIVKSIKKSPYDVLCKINGIGFTTADKTLLDAYYNAPNLWDFNLESSKYRCTCFILYYLLNNLNGSTRTTKQEILNSMKFKYGLWDCVNSFEEALKDYRIYINDNNVMLMSVYLEEKNISNFIKKTQIVNETKKFIWDININDYSKINDFNLTNEQLKTLDLVNNNQFVLLNGYAGTGKSSSIKALINMLEDNQKTYVILAPTAKAAKQISKYTERNASTIHYLLCHDFPDFDKNVDEDNEFNNISNIGDALITESGVLDYDIIIIDESSMLSVQLFNTLLRYVNPERSKLLMIGDSYQLPSIQNGNLYQDLLAIDDIPKITLNTIFRYTEDGLVNVATNIRLGNKYLNGNKIQNIGNSYTFYQYDDRNELINAAMNKYVELINEDNNIEDIAILTAKNVGNTGTYLINNCIQNAINTITEFDDFISIKVNKQTIRFKENDVVMNIKNNYNAHPIDDEDEKILLANGQTGIVKSVNLFDNSMIIEIENKKFKFEYGDICNLRLAYCFTIHKAQGSQFKNVIYITTPEDAFMTSSNLMYVAVTRAQDNCYHFGDSNTVNRRVSERENLKRNTSLVNQYYNLN